MSILDDAIREHLELKRAHGADDAELKKLEDEAFGPPERPGEVDPAAEAPTEFMSAPEAPPAEAPSERREPNIADLQEAPEPAAPEAPPEPPADEAHPATEHEAIPEPADAAELAPEPEAGPNTAERHAIAEQPTELFDVESAIEAEPEAADAPAPSDDDLLDAEHAEPRLAPVDPLSGIEASAAEAEAAEEPLLEDEEEEDDFFSEQRLSDELNQALETPVEGEPQGGPRTEEPIPPGPHTEETEAHYAEREREEAEVEDDEAAEEEYEDERPAASSEPKPAGHEDVLEETPDFLEDAPEDDDLWFEQRPPKDFDFDD
ncbi:MAG TPA: hypothetical protein VFX45_07015 [Solirubrobacterales bacterium]|nr:hypothetical protein [Solirubrobacterales bacterium]